MTGTSSRRSYSQKDIKLLFGKAANRCAECRTLCHVDATASDTPVITGKIAHIVASSDDGPRGDPSFPPDDRDKYANLILLCGVCHDKVDGQPNTYTIKYLHDKKTVHEEWVEETLADQLAELAFAELDVLLSTLANSDAAADTSGFTLTAPSEKIAKNELSNEVQYLITQGMMQQETVGGLLSDMAKLDDMLPGRITGRFKEEYARLRTEDLSGDALFYGLLEFASLRSSAFVRRSLGLAVLTHLFVICEVFEP